MNRIAIALIALCAAVPAAAVEPDPELIKQAAATAGGEIVVRFVNVCYYSNTATPNRFYSRYPGPIAFKSITQNLQAY